MHHAIARSLLCLLLAATLIWGGCVSCPQFFMSPASGSNACCTKTGKCKDTAPASQHDAPKSKDCIFQPAHLSAHSAGDVPAPVAAVAAFIEAAAQYIPARQIEALTAYSPPDRLALYSTFLI